MDRLLDLSRPGAIASPGENVAIEALAGGTVTIDDSDRQAKTVAALAEASRPAWRAARRRWTQRYSPETDPDDPTPLVVHLLERPMAARSIRREPDSVGINQQAQHWREQVAMALQDFQ
jgi:hypothetical protein